MLNTKMFYNIQKSYKLIKNACAKLLEMVLHALWMLEKWILPITTVSDGYLIWAYTGKGSQGIYIF